ncbi:hypothetical protein FRC19_002105 [Serendipita sp. 401]|nr:hypothetical protein FRC19_002105 [Serendipita sp. 401]
MSTLPRTSPALRISAITIRLHSRRSLRSITFSINEIQRDDNWVQLGQDSLTATFTPPLNISTPDHLKLELNARLLRIGPKAIAEMDQVLDIHVGELLHNHADQPGQRELKETYGKVEVIILLWNKAATISQSNTITGTIAGTSSDYEESANLVPTTEDVLYVCPRFRILLIGKTGVGKSSLINETFGVRDALVSDFAPGQADIETEIFSEKNPQFVLHDSRGFEPGEEGSFQTVRDFIQTRDKMLALKDKLHAIWVCMAIPVSGGRLLEIGLELFHLKNEGALGDVPMIAVFTKFDELVVREDRRHDADLSEEELSELAEKAFERECLEPFRTKVGHQIPYNAVSTQEGYESTLTDLIRVTFENVQHHFGPEASIVTAIAQKASSIVKIEGCIAVGRLRYWKGLASSINFPGKTLETCLDVVHMDIVNVWELDDPRKNLKSREFKALVTQLVSDNIHRKPPTDPKKSIGAGLALLGTIAGVVSALSGPAAPIVIPVVGGLVLAKWVYDVYEASRNNLEHLIAYIIHLTLIMQNIFWIAKGERPTSKKLISLASVAYLRSSVKEEVHAEISDYVRRSKFAPGARDTTLQKIEDIIHRCAIPPDEMFKLVGEIPPFDAENQDDSWQTE